jgi:uncharacterized protein (TIGR02246 family)
MNEPNSGIDALYAAWSETFRRRDVDAILGLLTPDYFLWALGTPPMGREALRPRLAAVFASYDVVPEFESVDRIVSGDLAFECGWDIQQVSPRAGGETHSQRQRVFLVLRRGEDGTWRFARGMSQPGPAA